MYETFYGMREKPFSLLPDPAHLYLSKQHQMAMTLLEYCLENQAGFCVITGDIGTGKTTLIRYLLNRIGDDISVGLISNTHQSFDELLRWILPAFGLEAEGKSKAALHRTFSDYLIGQYAKNRRTMLIVDEAQNMSSAALEELRMLSNINSEKDLVLQVMLVGQPGLRELLQRPELEQLTQRVAVDYHLKPLNCVETHGYIRHRVTVVGGKPELFSDAACDAVFRYSGGTPRLINLLCDLVLVYAYAETATAISGELVDQVVRERQAHGALSIFANDVVLQEKPVVASPRSVEVSAVSRPVSTAYGKRHSSRAVALEMHEPEIVAGTGPDSAVAGMAARAQAAMAMKFAEQGGGDRRFGTIPKVVAAPVAVSQAMPAAPNHVPAVEPEEVALSPVSATTSPVSMQQAAGRPPVSEREALNILETGIAEAEPAEAPMPENASTQDLMPAAATTRFVSSKKRTLPIGLAAGFLLTVMASAWWVIASKPAWMTGSPETIAAGEASKTLPGSQPVAAAVVAPEAGVNSRNAVVAQPAPVQNDLAANAGYKDGSLEQSRLRATERERDTALATARTLERERHAVLEAAKAVAMREVESLREQTAVSEYKAALDKEALAGEGDTTSQALMAALAEKKMLEEQAANEMSHEPAVTEPVSAPVQTAEETPGAVTSLRKVSAPSRREQATAAVKSGAGTPSGSTPDPCRSPAARFLSACKP